MHFIATFKTPQILRFAAILIFLNFQNVLNKLDLYARNILYANISFTPPDLTEYYKLLKIEPGLSDYLESELAIDAFSKVEEKRQLLAETMDRSSIR